MVRKMILVSALMLTTVTMCAQRNASDYFVKTNNVKVVAQKAVADSTKELKETTRNIMNELFPRLSLCDWTDTMAFMVMPDKQDLVVRIFKDGNTGNRMSTTQLRHKILKYAGRTYNGSTENNRIYFVTDDQEKHPYYFEVPSGSFEDYCILKLGVPSLAYLNDIETARKTLIGKTLITKATSYWVDANYGEGADEISVPLDTEVKVVNVGIGTRKFPVKIIVEDGNGRQFFQNVAMSRTNSGLRDEEFNMMDNQNHTFNTAFDMLGDFALPSWHYKDYVGKTVFTLRATNMLGGREEVYRAPALTSFKIIAIKSLRDKRSVKMTLQHVKTKANYTKEVFIKNKLPNGNELGQLDNIYENLFAEGNPSNVKGISPSHLESIRQGKIQKGFSEAEVLLIRTDGYEVTHKDNKTYTWMFKALEGKTDLRVTFDKRTKRVVSFAESR